MHAMQRTGPHLQSLRHVLLHNIFDVGAARLKVRTDDLVAGYVYGGYGREQRRP